MVVGYRSFVEESLHAFVYLCLVQGEVALLPPFPASAMLNVELVLVDLCPLRFIP